MCLGSFRDWFPSRGVACLPNVCACFEYQVAALFTVTLSRPFIPLDVITQVMLVPQDLILSMQAIPNDYTAHVAIKSARFEFKFENRLRNSSLQSTHAP